MEYTIENEDLKVAIRGYGAELTSVFAKASGIEHLWQADEQYWPWHAPVLFPVVGRCLNDEIVVDGKTYPMEKHGFARKSMFKADTSADKAVFTLDFNTDTLQLYPYKFQFQIAYELKGNQLLTHYTVKNQDDKPLYFCLGGHPAFSAPFVSGESYEDYYLEFEKNENSVRHLINTDGFFYGNVRKVFENSSVLPLQPQMFSEDAYIFKDLQSRKVTLRSKKNAHFLSVEFKGFEYLGVWAKVGAPYVCIEPWLGCADTAGKRVDLSEKEGAMKLGAGEEFKRSLTFEVG